MFTSYGITKILNGIFQAGLVANPNTLYFAGFPTPPTRTGGGQESLYPGYARTGVTASLVTFPSATGTNPVTIKNANAILFPQALAGANETWNAIAHFDALSAGNMWAYYTLGTGIPIAPGTIVQIGANELTGQLNLSSNGGFTTYAAIAILNCIYAKKAVLIGGITTFYLAGFTSNPAIDGSGNESNGGVRLAIALNPTNWSAATGTNPVITANNNPLVFPTLNVTENWVGWGLWDQPTPGTGNMWSFGLLQTPLPVNNSAPTFPIGSIQTICTGTL